MRDALRTFSNPVGFVEITTKPEVTKSLPPNAEVKNVWSFASAAQYAFKMWC
jgi:hypothetical protein